LYNFLLKSDFDTGDLNRMGHDPALFNEGDYSRLLRVHRLHAARVALGSHDVRPIGRLLMPRLADARTMRVACDALLRDGGSAPGVNGHRLTDWANADTWSLCRTLAETIRAGTYRPGPDLHHAISKGAGRGERILTIQNIEDRIVGKAAEHILEPVVDPTFSDGAVGFRPGRGPHDALAMALNMARREDRWVWLSADIADAFDAVPHARFLDVCGRHFPEDVVAFIDLISNTGDRHGLRQGSPASPLFFNLFANHFIDQRWRDTDGKLLRFADDLLVLCRTVEEARTAYAMLTGITRAAGTPLKCDHHIAQIQAGEQISWLGYLFQHQGTDLTIRIAAQAWDRLQENLAAAHLRPDAPFRAVEIVWGWLGYLGPCYMHEERNAVIRRIHAIASDQAFDEIPSRKELTDYWQRAYARWQRLCGHEDPATPPQVSLDDVEVACIDAT